MKGEFLIKRCDADDIGHMIMRPIVAADIDKLTGRSGEVVRAEVKKNRNPLFHRLFMAELRMVVDNSPESSPGISRWKSVEHLLVSLKYALGLYDLERGFDGEMRPIPRSISFEEMDDDEFREKVFDPAQPLLAAQLGISVVDLQNFENAKEYL